MTVIIALVILAAAVYHFRDVTLQPDERSTRVVPSRGYPEARARRPYLISSGRPRTAAERRVA